MICWIRRYRARNAGYVAGLGGQSRDVMPAYTTIQERVAWVTGWTAGHDDQATQAAW